MTLCPDNKRSRPTLNSISAALSSPVYVPPRKDTAGLDYEKKKPDGDEKALRRMLSSVDREVSEEERGLLSQTPAGTSSPALTTNCIYGYHSEARTGA